MPRLPSIPGAVLCACLLGRAAASGAEPAGKRLVPDAAAESRAEKVVRDAFKADYAKRKPAEIAALSAKLLEHGRKAGEDPALQYVALREARDLAAQCGDADACFAAIDEIASRFDPIDRVAMKTAAISTLLKSATGPAAIRRAALEALAAAYEAAAGGRFPEAGRAAGLAQTAAPRAKSPQLLALVAASQEELSFLRREQPRHRAAARALLGDPADARAGLTAGRYLCLVEGDWKKGLPLLEAHGDAGLKKVAAAEREKPADAAARLALGDLWFDLAEKEDGRWKDLFLVQARAWYRLALPQLDGIQDLKTAAEAGERVARIDKAAGAIPTERLGGGGGGPVDDAPAGRGYAVGLGVAPGGVIHGLQAVYRTPEGVVRGKMMGTGGVQEIVAREGYAVGGLIVQTGSRVDGLQIVFMRLAGGRLDPGDAYTSDWLGGRGGGPPTRLGCTGKLVVGFHAWCGLDIDSVSLLLAP